MNKPTTGFWRGFTWKRFARYSLLFFLLTFTISMLVDYFDQQAAVAANFTLRSIIIKAIKAILLGFVCAVWFEPGIDRDKENPPLIG